MVDRQLVLNKLESILRCIHRIETKRPDTLDQLAQDLDVQDIIIVNIERAVQLSVDICIHWITAQDYPAPKTMGDAFAESARIGIIPLELANKLSKSVGFRNIAVHQYEKIDWSIVYVIIWNKIDDFRQFCGYISEALDTFKSS
ncbi:DUF86 domain-containing protein [Gracilinema caldarium]|uniref:type VII toxin-antitoxin system HepT family RNase toxin n=1 Tax=Gracilinema caldarium TaxID=215591 RepID=UPI0026F1C04D|nr:DUF86 domain-containing protein [Gracilinema caldarium]